MSKCNKHHVAHRDSTVYCLLLSQKVCPLQARLEETLKPKEKLRSEQAVAIHRRFLVKETVCILTTETRKKEGKGAATAHRGSVSTALSLGCLMPSSSHHPEEGLAPSGATCGGQASGKQRSLSLRTGRPAWLRPTSPTQGREGWGD